MANFSTEKPPWTTVFAKKNSNDGNSMVVRNTIVNWYTRIEGLIIPGFHKKFRMYKNLESLNLVVHWPMLHHGIFNSLQYIHTYLIRDGIILSWKVSVSRSCSSCCFCAIAWYSWWIDGRFRCIKFKDEETRRVHIKLYNFVLYYSVGYFCSITLCGWITWFIYLITSTLLFFYRKISTHVHFYIR